MTTSNDTASALKRAYANHATAVAACEAAMQEMQRWFKNHPEPPRGSEEIKLWIVAKFAAAIRILNPAQDAEAMAKAELDAALDAFAKIEA